ncbi:hypothetical protein BJ322DRAFT_1044151 [Thelephora terrestris]|uniref:Uncharacterized protein n=1 Tax=Thelephora terrestris TaxID=56493 RepID=A0A9P6LAX0_9AGAM|nr:hypothetical protein BJ322DRAFT_1044151 [Thelephora terrestris]
MGVGFPLTIWVRACRAGFWPLLDPVSSATSVGRIETFALRERVVAYDRQSQELVELDIAVGSSPAEALDRTGNKGRR